MLSSPLSGRVKRLAYQVEWPYGWHIRKCRVGTPTRYFGGVGGSGGRVRSTFEAQLSKIPTYSEAGGASSSSTSAPFSEPLDTRGRFRVIDSRICSSTHSIMSIRVHATFRLRNVFYSATSCAAAAWRSIAFAMTDEHSTNDAIASVPGR